MEKKKKGFTLVELSIVLIIIGLLIGGILAAQSMISTAKVNAVAMQIGQFDAGVENFKTKYNGLPGNAPAFGGDGDGIIDQSDLADGHDNQVNTFACDIANFFHDIDPVLFPGGEICSRAGIPPAISGPQKNVPESKLGAAGSFIMASVIGTGGYTNTTNPINYYGIIGPQQPEICCPDYNGFYFTNPTNGAVKPVDALALDKKIDDGVGTTGNVLSGMINNIGPGYGGIYPAAIPECSNGSGIYNLATTSYACNPLIRIGASAGDPQ